MKVNLEITFTTIRCRKCGKIIRTQHVLPLVKEAWICCGEPMEILEDERGGKGWEK